MGKPLIVVGSITYAMKSREILSRNDIRSSIERTPRNWAAHGCSYSVYVPYRTDDAEKILTMSGIKVYGRMELGGEP